MDHSKCCPTWDLNLQNMAKYEAARGDSIRAVISHEMPRFVNWRNKLPIKRLRVKIPGSVKKLLVSISDYRNA